MSKQLFRMSVVPVLFLFSLWLSPPVHSAESDTVYDIQCGCYKKSSNVQRMVQRLQELDLSWYSVQSGHFTCLILDINVNHEKVSTFLDQYPEFSDAVLVKNYWDLPHPNPMRISPLPTSEDFTAIMVPYMQKEYKRGYYNRKRLPLARKQAEMYARFIYDASRYYDLDPFLLFALGNFETYFRNMNGDLDHVKNNRPDPAQGIFQILESTERVIYRNMKKQNIPHTPAELPTNLRKHPKTQIYFAGHYLHTLHTKHYNNRYMALLAYNGRHSANYDYPRRVMRFYQRAIKHFIETAQQCRTQEIAMMPPSIDRLTTIPSSMARPTQ
ncbi:MAG: transglycosylase SLT domain-containing protein [Deltaproteobacteria bacterium]|nr:transglycosylase SLT domain-containing protein [Deltaproteobacteria bacterium]